MTTEPVRQEETRGYTGYRWFSIILTVAVLVLVFFFIPGAIPFREFGTDDVTRLITSAILIALFIERTTEIILIAWRGRDKRQVMYKVYVEDQKAFAKGLTKETKHLEEDVEKANAKLASFRAGNQRLAILTGLTLGIFVSALGVRLIQPLLEPTAVEALSMNQYRWFAVVDVFITGALLGGGAYGLHKILDWFLKAVDVKREGLQEGKSGTES
jgi:hypothetical protein